MLFTRRRPRVRVFRPRRPWSSTPVCYTPFSPSRSRIRISICVSPWHNSTRARTLHTARRYPPPIYLYKRVSGAQKPTGFLSARHNRNDRPADADQLLYFDDAPLYVVYEKILRRPSSLCSFVGRDAAIRRKRRAIFTYRNGSTIVRRTSTIDQFVRPGPIVTKRSRNRVVVFRIRNDKYNCQCRLRPLHSCISSCTRREDFVSRRLFVN